MNIEQKVIALETKLAFQEATAEELSQEIYQQQQQIYLLEKQVQQLMKKLTLLGEANPEPNHGNTVEQLIQEKPPHY